MNIRSLDRERQHGLHGMVVNVSIDAEKTVDQLPRTFFQSETIQLQLFRKMSFKKPYLYETIRPNVVLEATRFLTTTELFKQEKIVVSDDWGNSVSKINTHVDFIVNPSEQEDDMNKYPSNEHDVEDLFENLDELLKEIDEWDETKEDLPINPGSLDTLLVSNKNVLMKLAPGESRKPLYLSRDKFVEELAYPCVFAGSTRDLPEDLSILKKSLSDILRYDRRYSTNIPLLFLKYKLVETACLNSAISICMRKSRSSYLKDLTVSEVLNDENMEKMVENDEAFKFLKTRSYPAFWHQKQRELMSKTARMFYILPHSVCS